MAESNSKSTNADQSLTEDDADIVVRITRTLDQWRTRIDELIVQTDLARLDAREEFRKRLEVVENVYLAARSRLHEAHRDPGSSVTSLHQGLAQLVDDVRQAYESAAAVVRRSRNS